MNERIKELAEQSQKVIWSTDGNITELTDLDIEKFAELIVRECASRLEEDYIPEEDIIEGYNEDWDNTLRYAVTTIKEHFGIKE